MPRKTQKNIRIAGVSAATVLTIFRPPQPCHVSAIDRRTREIVDTDRGYMMYAMSSVVIRTMSSPTKTIPSTASTRPERERTKCLDDRYPR